VFGGHLPELVIVLILALVVFGPKRLPEIGGAVGKGIKEFRKGTSDIEESVTGPAPQIQSPPPSQQVHTVTPERDVQPAARDTEAH
jgi:sec-independent protein translocase protein TatA